jgi:hypothetical protein
MFTHQEKFICDLEAYWKEITGYNGMVLINANIKYSAEIFFLRNKSIPYMIQYNRLYPLNLAKAFMWHEYGHIKVGIKTKLKRWEEEYGATSFALDELLKRRQYKLRALLFLFCQEFIDNSSKGDKSSYYKMAKEILKNYKFPSNKIEERFLKSYNSLSDQQKSSWIYL